MASGQMKLRAPSAAGALLLAPGTLQQQPVTSGTNLLQQRRLHLRHHQQQQQLLMAAAHPTRPLQPQLQPAAVACASRRPQLSAPTNRHRTKASCSSIRLAAAAAANNSGNQSSSLSLEASTSSYSSSSSSSSSSSTSSLSNHLTARATTLLPQPNATRVAITAQRRQLRSSLISSSSSIGGSSLVSVPITRSGVHQSIRLQRRSLQQLQVSSNTKQAIGCCIEKSAEATSCRQASPASERSSTYTLSSLPVATKALVKRPTSRPISLRPHLLGTNHSTYQQYHRDHNISHYTSASSLAVHASAIPGPGAIVVGSPLIGRHRCCSSSSSSSTSTTTTAAAKHKLSDSIQSLNQQTPLRRALATRSSGRRHRPGTLGRLGSTSSLTLAAVKRVKPSPQPAAISSSARTNERLSLLLASGQEKQRRAGKTREGSEPSFAGSARSGHISSSSGIGSGGSSSRSSSSGGVNSNDEENTIGVGSASLGATKATATAPTAIIPVAVARGAYLLARQADNDNHNSDRRDSHSGNDALLDRKAVPPATATRANSAASAQCHVRITSSNNNNSNDYDVNVETNMNTNGNVKNILQVNNKFPSNILAPNTNVIKAQIEIKNESICDHYDVEAKPFARGKFAQVKRCISKTSDQCFAAKCIKKRRRLVDIRHEILLEIEALKLSYKTDRIVKLYEVYETPTEMILVLEMANGGELQRVLDDEEVIAERLVKRWVKQILEGLIQLHQNDIAHLDIKPQNLLLTNPYPNGDIKLCDFGLSRRITKDCEIREICGTPDYVAPEILSYDPITLATDMWSLGVLTYVLLSGYSPFGSENKQQTFCNITQAKLEPFEPEEIFCQISNSAKLFLRQLIIRDPSKRLTSEEASKHQWFTSCH